MDWRGSPDNSASYRRWSEGLRDWAVPDVRLRRSDIGFPQGRIVRRRFLGLASCISPFAERCHQRGGRQRRVHQPARSAVAAATFAHTAITASSSTSTTGIFPTRAVTLQSDRTSRLSGRPSRCTKFDRPSARLAGAATGRNGRPSTAGRRLVVFWHRLFDIGPMRSADPQ